MIKRLLSAMGLLLLLAGETCEGDDIIRDNDFQLWCGDQLCDWGVTEGSAEPSPTWHERDPGIALLGDRVVLSQLAADETNILDDSGTGTTVNLGPTCVLFEVIADIEPTAEMSVVIDFSDDDQIEFEQQIGATDWRPTQFLVRSPLAYRGIRFRLVKDGPGAAVLGRVRATTNTDCLHNLGTGEPCSSPDQCQSGACGSAPPVEGEPPYRVCEAR